MEESIIGKVVYIRSNMSGVWRGTLAAHADDYAWVKLTEAEHFYRWQTNKGVTVAGLAASGANRAASTIDPPVHIAIIRDVIEIVPEH